VNGIILLDDGSTAGDYSTRFITHPISTWQQFVPEFFFVLYASMVLTWLKPALSLQEHSAMLLVKAVMGAGTSVIKWAQFKYHEGRSMT
jgi:hypothetical protein